MTIAAPPRPLGPGALTVAMAALTPTQIIGWGTTFHVAAALSGRIAAGTGLPSSVVFGGITVMLLVAAAFSPMAGRMLDRDGARRWMTVGSILSALGLLVLSRAEGPVLFGLAWIVFGVSMPFALNQGSSTALVQIAPDRARRAIALLLLLSGFASTLFWPFLIWLDGLVGWRDTLLVCAAIQAFICAPLHFFGLPAGRVLTERQALAPPEEGGLPPRAAEQAGDSSRLFLLVALCFSLAGMLTWGLPLHLIGLLEGYGHSQAQAVLIGGLLGPGQVLARAFEMAGGHRFGILAVGVGSMALLPVAIAVLMLWGTTPAGAILFVTGYGLSAGLISVVRAVAPLRLFGPAAYALMLGRLGLPQNLAFAAAPVGFAVLREQFGAPAVMGLSLAVSLVCVAAMVAIWRMVPEEPGPT